MNNFIVISKIYSQFILNKRLSISVKRLRREKGASEEVNVDGEVAGPSLLGKRTHEPSENESENEAETEIDRCSRTL